MPSSELNNINKLISVEYVFSHIPNIFHPYLNKIKNDDKAILVVYFLYLHIYEGQNRLKTLQQMAEELSVCRNTLIRIFYLLEEMGLFECHYIVKNKYEGKSFNKKIIASLGLNTTSGEHIFIFSKTYNNINDWLNTPSYIKELYIPTNTLTFYEFTNQLIVQLLKHPLDRVPFFKNSNSLSVALNLLIHHGVIRKELNPSGYSFVHKHKLTPTAKSAIQKELAENSNPSILKRGDWHHVEE